MGFVEGIWVLWNPNTVFMETVAFSFWEIHLECKVNNFSFLLTALYASPNFECRKLLWSSFTSFSSILNKPWLRIRDFNEISKPSEKFGGGPPSKHKMKIFNNFLNVCELIDLGSIGAPLPGQMADQVIRLSGPVLTEPMQILIGYPFQIVKFSTYQYLDLIIALCCLKPKTSYPMVPNLLGLKLCG